MTITPFGLTYSLAYGGDGKARTNDPLGAFGRGIEGTATIAPVIALITPKDQKPASATTVSVTFRNTGGDGYFWKNKGPDAAVITLSQDRKEATLTWNIPATERSDSIYFSVGCHNDHGIAIAYDIVHVGKTQVIRCGPSVGNDYPNWRLAKPNLISGGTCIFEEGTSNNKDFWIGVTNGQSNAYMPPSGVFTTTQVNGETLRNVTQFTTVMCEKPFGFVFDCANLSANEYGLMIYGTEDYDQKEKDFDAYLAGLLAPNVYFPKFNTPQFASPAQQCAIAVKGFISKGRSIFVQRASWIYAQYCGAITTEGNYFGIYLSGPCKDILTEYCLCDGRGTSQWATYKVKNVIARRMIVRTEEITQNGPHGGFVAYQVRGGRIQNGYDIGSNSGDFWTVFRDQFNNLFPAQGSFVNPETDFRNDGVIDYSLDIQFQNCGACDTDRSLFNIDSNERPNTDNTVGFDGLFATEIQIQQSSCALVDQGPVKGSHLYVQKVASLYGNTYSNGPYGSLFFRGFGGKQDINKFILADLGYDRTTKNTNNVGRLWYSESIDPQNMTDGYVWNFKGSITENTQFTTQTNVNYETLNPYTNGYKYAHRMERGSVLYNLGFNRNNFFAVGRSGQFFRDAGFQEQIGNAQWIEQFMYELESFWSIIRPITFTGAKNNGIAGLTTGTLAWGRNIALAGENWAEYIMKKSKDEPVPYPYRVMVYKNGGTLYVDVPPFADLNHGAITAFNIYANGQKIGSIASSAFGYRNTSLSPGVLYSITVTAQTATAESGHSEPVEITI